MPDSEPRDRDSDAARIELEPDALHERDDGLAIDCPECGSLAPIQDVVEYGRCRGYLDAEATETAEAMETAEDVDLPCTADLSLELVWRS